MNSKIKDEPLHWSFWHPHQKLWNWQLIATIKRLGFFSPLTRLIIKSIVELDTFLLSIRILLVNKNLNKSGYSPNKSINYFDLGTHKKAEELNWVVEEVLSKLPNPYKIFAFEANPDSYNIAINNCNQIDELKLYNLALVNKIPKSGQIKLFTCNNGLGDSIYRTELDSFMEVEAKRLSDVIKNENVKLDESINIIRMNIEGCEFDVIENLIDNDLIKYFDGFYGMWDDVSKIDIERDRRFRKVLKEANVYPFPFNGRDMKHKRRKSLINKSLRNSIMGRDNRHNTK